MAVAFVARVPRSLGRSVGLFSLFPRWPGIGGRAGQARRNLVVKGTLFNGAKYEMKKQVVRLKCRGKKMKIVLQA